MRYHGGLLIGAAFLAVVGSPLMAQRVAEQELFWPPPPEEPRIRYVGSLGTEKELGRSEGFFSKLKRAILGGEGPRYLQIERPFDIHVQRGTRYYFTNGSTRAVFMFDTDAKKAEMLGVDVPGGLAKPMGLGGGPDGTVYVADASLRRVVVFDSLGAYVRMFGDGQSLLNPVDVAVDPTTGVTYVVDSYQHQVVVFDRDGMEIGRIGKRMAAIDLRSHDVATSEINGDLMEADHAGMSSLQTSDLWENRGAAEGEFRYPGSVDVGPDGVLYVSDQMNFRVQSFDRDGQFLLSFGGLGDRPGNFTRPKGVAVDSEGNVYVVDASFSNVQVFAPNGELLISFGQLGHGDGEHWLPLGIAVDRSTNRIYVADRYNNRAQIYQLLPIPSVLADEGEDGG